MKSIWKNIGTILFFAAWPALFVYFKIWNKRTRVIVTSGSKILLVKGWLAKNEWMLPGGGIKSPEDSPTAAAREIYEETGLKLNIGKMTKLGQLKTGQYLLNYTAEVFRAELNTTENVRAKFPEIIDVSWFDRNDLSSLKLSKEAEKLINKYS